MIKGVVFSILRGSLHDGPGIRTTVFLKGCNLRCLWCHNPEGDSPEPQLAYRAHQCIGCGLCAQVCPRGAHRFSAGAHTVDFSVCGACGACAQSCPTGALQLYGRPMAVPEVMETVLRDRRYYGAEGGLTLSGGEPLLQPAFVRELLLAAKQENLHTCIETAGCVPPGTLEMAAPLTDLFLFDYKASTQEQHRALTGADNDLILQNLHRLYTQGAKLRLRCPIVPGCNDTDAHFAAIAALARKYPALEGIELMPYHDFGVSKAASLGQEPRFAAATATEQQKQQWLGRLHALGAATVLETD